MDSNKTVGYALALFLIFKEKFENYKFDEKTHIFIDHDQQLSLAKEFAKLCEISKINIVSLLDDVDYNIPRRTPLFDKEDKVIILTSIISSSETIRRLVKFVKRDFAIPLCILCLINKREYDINVLETWGSKVSIYSIFQENVEINFKVKSIPTITHIKNNIDNILKCEKIVSPRLEEKNKVNIEGEPLIMPELREYLIKTKSLHYNHIGSVNGRHFTFYLNKKKILQDESFIWKRFYEMVSEWLKQNDIKEVVFFKPIYNKDDNNIWNNCIDYLKKKIQKNGITILSIENWNMDRPAVINRYANIVYFDFGAMTGKSLNTFLSNISKTERILICVLFAQFQNDDQEFYRRIGNITYVCRESEQNVLFDQEIVTKTQRTDVLIKFIFDFPINFYSSSTCPICEHENALEHYKMDTEYMVQFTNYRKKRLKIREKDTIPAQPIEFYSDEDKAPIELSIVLILKMYEFKRKLEYALKMTEYRIRLYRDLCYIYEQINEQIKNPDSDLYAFLYFISFEVMWFQKEPLIFRDFRVIISEIARKVAVENIANLVACYKKTNLDESVGLKIAIRYKYASITVLRSAHKLMFCESITQIIYSSVYKKAGLLKLSNNLFQNTFYHIHSLHQNRYNRGIKYFGELDKCFNSLEEENNFIPFIAYQRLLLENVKIENLNIKRRIELENKDMSDLSIVKAIKKELEQLFVSVSHPEFYTAYQALDFRHLNPKAIEDLEQNMEKSDYVGIFNARKKRLLDKWFIVKMALIPTLKPYMEKLSDLILKSQIFIRNDYSNNIWSFFEEISAAKLFENLILKVSENTQNLVSYYKTYHIYYDKIYENFIQYKKIEKPETVDSLLLRFFENFPGNLENRVNANFNKEDYYSLTIEIPEDCCKVFYPVEMLDIYFTYIRNNIKEKLRSGKELKDVSLSFKAEKINSNDKYVKLVVINDNTESTINRNGGGLCQFREDLILYGGDLKYGSDIKNNFKIEINFLAYE